MYIVIEKKFYKVVHRGGVGLLVYVK